MQKVPGRASRDRCFPKCQAFVDLHAFCHIDNLFSKVFVQPQEKGKTKRKPQRSPPQSPQGHRGPSEAASEPAAPGRSSPELINVPSSPGPLLAGRPFACGPRTVALFQRRIGGAAARGTSARGRTAGVFVSDASALGSLPEQQGRSEERRLCGLIVSRVWDPDTLQPASAFRRAVCLRSCSDK